MVDEAAIRELVEKMTQERDRLLAQIEALGEADAEQAPAGAEGEAQWSAKEQCAHLAEMETGYRAWVERALVEENPDVAGVRGDPVAVPLEQANGHPVSELVAERRPQRSSGSRSPSAFAAWASSQISLPRPVFTGISGTVAIQPPIVIIIHSCA